MDIGALCQCLTPAVPRTTVRQCSRIAAARRALTGRVPRLGRSHWAGPGGSDRTVQRLVSTVLPWAPLFGVVLRQHRSRPAERDLLAGDAGVVTTAGQHPYGVDRCLASVSRQPISGVACFARSVGSGQARRAFPIRIEPSVRSAAERGARQATAAAKQPPRPRAPRRAGRPKGRKNTDNADGRLTREVVRIPSMIDALLHLIATGIPVTSLGLDGHVGTHNAGHRAPHGHGHLLSTLRAAAAFSVPSAGPDAGTWSASPGWPHAG